MMDITSSRILSQNTQKGSREYMVVDHLSCLIFDNDELHIIDSLPDKQLFSVKTTPRYADIVNFYVASEIP